MFKNLTLTHNIGYEKLLLKMVLILLQLTLTEYRQKRTKKGKEYSPIK